MECKPFKSTQEQIDLLKQRNLIINDDCHAANVLEHVNYYRLSGYTLTLRKDDIFYPNVTLEQIMQIYNFDAELRIAILYILEYIEVSFRTHVGYYHAKTYGPLGYLDKSTFEDESRYDLFYKEFTKLIEQNDRNEVFIKHHKQKYDNQFPIWVIAELLSFGCLSRLYKNLSENLKKEICKNHYHPIPYDYIENWLQVFTVVRNICAHRGRLFNRYMTFAPKLSNKDRILFNDNNVSLNKGVKQIFTIIYIMDKLIKDSTVWNTFMGRIEILIKKYPFVKMSHYGFPDEWEKILLKR